MRIGTAERRACAAALQQHRDQGRLDDAECRDRLRRVDEAVYDTDLSEVFADLPGGTPPMSGDPGLAPFTPREPDTAYADRHPDATVAGTSGVPAGSSVAGSAVAGTGGKTSGVAPRTPDPAWRKFLAMPFVAIAATAGFFLTEGWSHAWVWFLAIPFSVGLSGFLANRGAGRRGGLLLMVVMLATAMSEITGDMDGRSWLWYLLIPAVVFLPMGDGAGKDGGELPPSGEHRRAG